MGLQEEQTSGEGEGEGVYFDIEDDEAEEEERQADRKEYLVDWGEEEAMVFHANLP